MALFKKSNTAGWIMTGFGCLLILAGTVPPLDAVAGVPGFSNMNFAVGGLFVVPGLLILLRNQPSNRQMRAGAGVTTTLIGFVILWPFLVPAGSGDGEVETLEKVLPFILTVLIFFGIFFLAQGLAILGSGSDGGKLYRIVWRGLAFLSFAACLFAWYTIATRAVAEYRALDPDAAYRWIGAAATAVSAFAAFLFSLIIAVYGWMLLPGKLPVAPRGKAAENAAASRTRKSRGIKAFKRART